MKKYYLILIKTGDKIVWSNDRMHLESLIKQSPKGIWRIEE